MASSCQGYLAHKKPPPPPRTAIGASAWSYCRVLRGGGFLYARYPCMVEGLKRQAPQRRRRSWMSRRSSIRLHPD